MISPFRFARNPRLIFGAGSIEQLGSIVLPLGSRTILLTGVKSAEASGSLGSALRSLKGQGVSAERVMVRGEPSPEAVDDLAEAFRNRDFQSVTAFGGGSVIDAAKALAAMLTVDGSVVEYLEDVGLRRHPGTTLPVIAIPTTAGTGSEATKNAVISKVGEKGFKKSLRHDNFVPVAAIVDPCLTITCTAAVTAACGMDAFTQLLESYVSTKANPLTDSLALGGIEHLAHSLVSLVTDDPGNLEKRSAVAYAAFVSGVTLANAGLGVIHGLAGVLGGSFSIPHGVACGTLLAPCVRRTIAALRKTENPASADGLSRFARIGRIVGGDGGLDDNSACEVLVKTLYAWTEECDFPPLSRFGIAASHLADIVSCTDQKTNPATLDDQALHAALAERL